ncbi:uncharacterized protein LOC117116201, partial [Anneissia japonica]|uniref:uncharacterized protein LOC117116201 n=1 Tax=Anneissia japonica TaxID=1529436 RepID=UPI0014256C06
GNLHDAIRRQRWDELRCMIRAQPLLVNGRSGGMTSLYWLVSSDYAPESLVLEFLDVATEEAVDDVNPFDDSILHLLALYGRTDALHRALGISSTRVDWQNQLGNTPLHYLVSANHTFLIHHHGTKALLDVGANSRMKNKNCLTPVEEYDRNECRKYDDIIKKYEILQLLQSDVVPGIILSGGAEAVKVFNEELETGEITVNHARLMMTGKNGVGKSCLVNTLLDKRFNEEEQSTDGIVLTTAFQTTDNECSKWKEQNVDECERIKQMYENALESNVAEKLKRKNSETDTSNVTPATKSQLPATSLTAAPVSQSEHVMTSKPTGAKGGNETGTGITGTTISPRQVFTSEIQTKILKRMTRKTSGTVRNDDITYIWDFAGQQLYYITHRIFLTSEAVYLILFNLMESMHAKGKCRVSRMAKDMTYNMTNIQIIKYWMRLIFTYAVPAGSQWKPRQKVKKPQIVVVGTHSESLFGTDEEKRKRIEDQYSIIFEEIRDTPYECHVSRKMYAIDNKYTSQSAEALKSLKQDVGELLKAMPKTIPLKWLEFQYMLQEIGKKSVHMQYAEVCKVATKCGISMKNLLYALKYLHDLGIILYFEKNELLRHTVITDPRKLIIIFKKIITEVKHYDEDKWPSMIKLWNKLDDEGVLEEELARHLWRNELSEDETLFEVFLELMKQFGLLCEQVKVLEFLKKELIVLTSGMKHAGYTLCVMCWAGFQDMHFHKLEDCLKNDFIRCGENLVITSKLQRKFKDPTESASSSNKEEAPDRRLGYLEERDLLLISKNIGEEFKQLGVRLGFSWKTVKQICYNRKQLLECTMEMLTKWRNRQTSETNQVEAMARALKEQGLTKLANKVFGSQTAECQPSSVKAYEDHARGRPLIKEKEHDGRLADIDMLFIGERLDKDWKIFGIYLGLKRSEINQIESDYSPPLVDASLEMLVKWREKQEDEVNHLVKMTDALNQLERSDIIEELQTYYREKYLSAA